MEEYKRVICIFGRTECPYHKDHCCLGEIDIRSLNGSIPLKERHCCKKKNSLKVIGVLAA